MPLPAIGGLPSSSPPHSLFLPNSSLLHPNRCLWEVLLQTLGHWCEERRTCVGESWSMGRCRSWEGHCSGWGGWRYSGQQSGGLVMVLACCSNSPHYLYQGWWVSLGWCGGPEDHDHDEQGPLKQAQAVRQGVEAHLPWRSEAQQGNLRVQAVDGGLQVVLAHIRLGMLTISSRRANSVTDFLVVHEHRGVPDGLVVCHLPHGPTAYFTMTDIVMRWVPPYQTLSQEYENLLTDTTSPTSAKWARPHPISCSTTSRRGSASAAWAFWNISSPCQRYQTKILWGCSWCYCRLRRRARGWSPSPTTTTSSHSGTTTSKRWRVARILNSKRSGPVFNSGNQNS